MEEQNRMIIKINLVLATIDLSEKNVNFES
jgi:hypothetical protein